MKNTDILRIDNLNRRRIVELQLIGGELILRFLNTLTGPSTVRP